MDLVVVRPLDEARRREVVDLVVVRPLDDARVDLDVDVPTEDNVGVAVVREGELAGMEAIAVGTAAVEGEMAEAEEVAEVLGEGTLHRRVDLK